MQNWYLLYVKPKNEDKVALRLFDCGFEVLNPKIKERKYVRRQLKEVTSPLFPCYLFVRFSIPGDFRLMRYTRGVRSIVGTENEPSAVPEEIISSIRNRIKQGPIVIKPREFKPGDEVIIRKGSFEGLTAVFEKNLKGPERVSVLLREISARVVVHAAALAKA